MGNISNNYTPKIFYTTANSIYCLSENSTSEGSGAIISYFNQNDHTFSQCTSPISYYPTPATTINCYINNVPYGITQNNKIEYAI
jgi:hypothetical protein